MNKLMIARFKSRCNYCDAVIEKGDGIIVNKSMPRKKRSYCSGACSDAAEKVNTKSIPLPTTKGGFRGIFA